MTTKDNISTFLNTIRYGFGKRDARGKRIYSILQLALFIFLSATIVFSVTASLSYYLTHKYAMASANVIMQQNMNLATEIIHNHVQQAESAGYSLTSVYFDKVDDRFVYDDNLPKPTINEIYEMLDNFQKTTSSVTGVCIGFEPGIYPEYGETGVAPFVRQDPENDTIYEWLNLPDMGSVYREKNWYTMPKEMGEPTWCPPYKDVKGAVITTFSIPVYTKKGNYIGTVAIDINLNVFSDRLKHDIHSFEGSEIMLIGAENKFLIHPVQSLVLESGIESIEHFQQEVADQDATLFYHKMDSDGMIVAVRCPNNAIYKNIDDLQSKLLSYGGLGLLLIEIICLLTFVQVRKVTEDKASIEGELTIASNIQMSMLPMMFPAFPDRKDIDLSAMLKPAKTVGGDLYDYVIRKNSHGEDTLVFTIGDVSGKGVPASLLMAVVCSLFRNTAMKTTDPKTIATDLNNCISERNEYNMFCTMFIGSMNLETGVLNYCNAGHNQPVLMKNGKAAFVDVVPNIPIGTFGGFDFESETLQMEIGDTLFTYTDGVTEAENLQHREYSDNHLTDVLREHIGGSSASITEAVAQSVKEFAGKAEQSDDITMLAVRRN